MRVFSAASVMVLILVLADSIEYWCASLDEPIMLRIWMSAIGYSLRPSIIFLAVSFVCRYEKNKKLLWSLPLILNIIIALSAFFTDIAYSYDSNNQFVRGPLGFFPFLQVVYIC